MTLVLEEIMEDAVLYSCANVRACHAILLQQIEWGHYTWASEAKRQRLHGSHIWNVASAKVTMPKPHSPPLKWQGKRLAQTVEVKPGTKAGDAFNKSACNKQEEHPNALHICQYCLSKENRACKHAKEVCNYKIHDAHSN